MAKMYDLQGYELFTTATVTAAVSHLETGGGFSPIHTEVDVRRAAQLASWITILSMRELNDSFTADELMEVLPEVPVTFEHGRIQSGYDSMAIVLGEEGIDMAKKEGFGARRVEAEPSETLAYTTASTTLGVLQRANVMSDDFSWPLLEPAFQTAKQVAPMVDVEV